MNCRLKSGLCLGITEVHIGRVQFGRDGLRLGEGIAHLTSYPHHAPDELHGKVRVIDRLGTSQYKCPWRVEACACRLLEDQHLLGGVIGNGGHQHRVRLVRRVFANGFRGHLAKTHQLFGSLINCSIAVSHLYEQQWHAVDTSLLQLPTNQHVAGPGLPQHCATEVCDLLHGRAKAIHYGFDVLLVQASINHIVAAYREVFLATVARMG